MWSLVATSGESSRPAVRAERSPPQEINLTSTFDLDSEAVREASASSMGHLYVRASESYGLESWWRLGNGCERRRSRGSEQDFGVEMPLLLGIRSGFMRMKCKSKADHMVGWVTVVGNAGTAARQHENR